MKHCRVPESGSAHNDTDPDSVHDTFAMKQGFQFGSNATGVQVRCPRKSSAWECIATVSFEAAKFHCRFRSICKSRACTAACPSLYPYTRVQTYSIPHWKMYFWVDRHRLTLVRLRSTESENPSHQFGHRIVRGDAKRSNTNRKIPCFWH